MTQHKLFGLSGSLRENSTGTKLLHEAARLYGECSFVLGNLNLPLYNGDDEIALGVPSQVQSLADQIAAADAVIVCTPEYNKGPSGVLKNGLDWISRTKNSPWKDKPVAIMSAAAGRAGGERAQMVLRGFMVPFRPRILQGPEIHLAASEREFDDNGQLTGDMYIRDLTQLMQALKVEVER